MAISEKESKFIEKWKKAHKNRYISYGGILLCFSISGVLIVKGFMEKNEITLLFGYFLVILSFVSVMGLREILKLYSILNKLMK